MAPSSMITIYTARPNERIRNKTTMREIFADSFYWIALANPKDQWHNGR